MKPPAATRPTKLLVIGYGNTLRSDDGVGPRAAEAIEKLQLPGVRSISCALLTPELAESISQAESVVFVDASMSAIDKVSAQIVAPADSAQIVAHAADPRTLLALARDLFHHQPTAWCIQIPVANLEIGEHLSARAHAGLTEAIAIIQRLA